jgi:hypothetical protein
MLVGDSFSTVFILKHYTLKLRIKTGAEKMLGICSPDFSLLILILVAPPGKTIHELDSTWFV